MSVAYQTAEAALSEIFTDLSEDLEAEPVDFAVDTRLVDLGLESISLIYLVSELQQHFGLGERLFQYLRDSDRLLVDMNVDDILKGVVSVSQTASVAEVKNA